ncbi:dipeptide ABC transporter ATP-binding protein [Sagittula sp. SSi028]|uniref:dipeptide ABC transporter ATP-binding protein n=1 Tax=Sagittula sp. SSi028 TaxID=3400636 RepID=UPI003AF5664A
MTGPLLSISSLDVTLSGRRLLHDVSLTLDAGETLALTGESGSGKSLTALAVMGLLPARMRTGGTITLGGTELTDLAPRARDLLRGSQIGMVFQEPMTALNPLHTIGQQIAEVFTIHGRPVPDIGGLLHRVGLDVPPGRYPHELSGGQRQRVVIAMAIALRPRLIIADEPTTALDVTTQAQILDLLKSLTQEDGSTLMLISHDLAVVSGMADRIAVMQNGQIVETAATEQLLRHPQHPYTRSLLAASSHRSPLPPAPPARPLLQAHDITVRYPQPRRGLRRTPDATTLDHVSLILRSGERVGLVGESGCGKSTLARALLGLQPLAGGQVTLADHPIADRQAKARIQVVFQDPYGSFNPRHKVGRLLAEPFHLRRPHPDRAQVDAAIAQALTDVGLSPDDTEKHIHAFSGGQRQRLAIARALVIEPDVIVLDEAVSALDVRVRAQVLDLLAGLSARRGLAWLFISHDLGVVQSITDRVLVMDQGRIVEDAPTAQIFASPKHHVTKRLLAAMPQLPETHGHTHPSIDQNHPIQEPTDDPRTP